MWDRRSPDRDLKVSIIHSLYKNPYYSRPVEKYNIDADAENYNSCTDGATKISSDGFEAWRKDIMASGKNARSCSLSADEKWVCSFFLRFKSENP